MTKTKRIASLAVSAMLAMSMMATSAVMNSAVASADCTITLTDTTNTYTYYQIFTGTVSGTAGSEVLTDAAFGSGIADTTAFLTALGLSSTATASDALAAMSAMSSTDIISALNTTGVLATGNVIDSGTTSVADGYYFITETLAGASSPVASGSILTFLYGNSETINTKYGAPSVEKKILEDDRGSETTTGENIGDDADGSGWNDVGDYSIGDTVNFVVYGTMPETLDSFTYYYYQFSDDLGAGFTLDTSSITVYYDLDGTSGTTYSWTQLTSSGYTVASTTEGFTITFNDIKAAISGITKDTVIKITYSATLNENAVVGATGNTNGVTLTYTNDTSYDGDGNPSNPETTTVDGVAAFTYTLSVAKTDDSTPAQSLVGVTFYLKDASGNYATVDSDNKVTGWATSSSNATLLTTDSIGQISVIGLDSGTYYLEEVSTLTGYNKLTDDVKIVISAGSGINTAGNWSYAADNGSTAYAEPTITVASVTTTGSSGVVSATVVNAKGSSLPETGSFGTKLFYIGGGVLVAAAGVILVTRKRMGRKAD